MEDGIEIQNQPKRINYTYVGYNKEINVSLPNFLAKQFISNQLALPSGIFGRYLMGKLLNRTTSTHNALVLKQLDIQPTDRVLEVGFGGAALLERIVRQTSEGFVAGVELSEVMVANANVRLRTWAKTGRLEIHQGNIESLPFPDTHFDKACSVNTVYFWSDLAKCFAELLRVIKPGGKLILGFTDDKDITGAGLYKRGFLIYSIDDLKAALTAQEFIPGLLESGSDARGTFYSLTSERK
jgi:arsenite methyltransferase